ncbi:MAG: ATP-grasp domain-containing protein [Deltaproteobacteria bacterium]|nr:ATP-grasp domain-containing protein [Deltaproteobacteria bacterium]
MNVLFCKWNKICIERLLSSQVNVYLMLDDFDIEHMRPEKTIIEKCTSLYRIRSFDSLEELSAVAVDMNDRNIKIDVIASFAEHSQYGAAYIAKLLNVDETSIDRAVLSRDKRAMKRKATQAGIATANFISIGQNKTGYDPQHIFNQLGNKVVVKPVSGVGAVSTVIIDTKEGLEKKILEKDVIETIFSRQYVIEEYIDGDEYHADIVWRNEQEWIFVIGKYFGPCVDVEKNPELSGSYYLPEHRHQGFYIAVRELHKKIAEAFKIERGIVHLEFFQKKNGEIVFSEIGTRVGGGYIPETIKAYKGIDLREIWIEELIDGKKENLAFAEKPVFPYLGWTNISPTCSGTIIKIPREQHLKENRHIVAYKWMRQLGERVEIAGSSTWCLLLLIGADSEQEMCELVRKLHKDIIIEAI